MKWEDRKVEGKERREGKREGGEGERERKEMDEGKERKGREKRRKREGKGMDKLQDRIKMRRETSDFINNDINNTDNTFLT